MAARPSASSLSSSSSAGNGPRAADVSVSIPSYETRTGAGRGSKEKFTTYCLAVLVGGSGGEAEWTVFRRYSQFLALHKSLDADVREALHGTPLPPKRMNGNFNDTFLQQRRAALEAYVTGLLVVDDIFRRAPDVKSFLGMNLHLLNGGNGSASRLVGHNKKLTEFNWVHRTGGIPSSSLRSAAANRRGPNRKSGVGGQQGNDHPGGSSPQPGSCVLL